MWADHDRAAHGGKLNPNLARAYGDRNKPDDAGRRPEGGGDGLKVSGHRPTTTASGLKLADDRRFLRAYPSTRELWLKRAGDWEWAAVGADEDRIDRGIGEAKRKASPNE